MPRAVQASASARVVTLSIGKAAERTGTGIEQLRAWQRRYGFVPGATTRGGHRRYTETDIARISFAQDLIRSGVHVNTAVRRAVAADATELRWDRTPRLHPTTLAEVRSVAAQQRLEAARQHSRTLELRERTRQRAETARAGRPASD